MPKSERENGPLHILRHRIRRAIIKIKIKINEMNELRIWRSRDCDGHCCWHGYDPRSGQSTSFGSESDIRAWIDQSHYFNF